MPRRDGWTDGSTELRVTPSDGDDYIGILSLAGPDPETSEEATASFCFTARDAREIASVLNKIARQKKAKKKA